MTVAARYPGIRVTANGNQLVSYHTETRIATPRLLSHYAFYRGRRALSAGLCEGHLNVFGQNTIAIETEGEHAAQGGALPTPCAANAWSLYLRPGRCVRRGAVLPRARQGQHHGHRSGRPRAHQARAHVHCGHDDIYGALDTG